MLMIRAIVRPEKTNIILAELNSAGFPAVTKMDVVGRGKQRGVKVGEVIYDEIAKEMLMLVVQDEKDKDDVVGIIAKYAKTGEKGAFGDGKIFVTPVEEAYTISSGTKGL
ncbi:P-II family nitrogen regulator [Desulforamulus ferrireducens]|uniref:Nitrogen fixation protein NifHD n=1 Tax=Desulforamulus ferrireducens TaxID=1833852 RepID=A0A1S6IXB6_9FIRM|nr:P-II family nitrogen regulator [Desulforamulus ferrireducens]AQS59395.1 nitrogen fixation protein NifHD [Desulforamulus ferrireducens]